MEPLISCFSSDWPIALWNSDRNLKKKGNISYLSIFRCRKLQEQKISCRHCRYSKNLYAVMGEIYLPKFYVWKTQILSFELPENTARNKVSIGHRQFAPCLLLYLFTQLSRESLVLSILFLSGVEFCPSELRLLCVQRPPPPNVLGKLGCSICSMTLSGASQAVMRNSVPAPTPAPQTPQAPVCDRNRTSVARRRWLTALAAVLPTWAFLQTGNYVRIFLYSYPVGITTTPVANVIM
jgi:hypothetical protein